MSEKEREIYEFEMDLNTKSAIYILTLTLSHGQLRCPQACFPITLKLNLYMLLIIARNPQAT